MSALPATQALISVSDYLEGEEISKIKHEYIAGEVWAMAGASDAHVTITLNIASLLRIKLRGKLCRPYMSDMKVSVQQDDAFYYPDVFVSCTESDRQIDYYKEQPIVIIEVLSKSTEAYDRGDKFASYRKLASLQEYVLINTQKQQVEVFRKNEIGQWVLFDYVGDDEISFTGVDFSCSLNDIYEDVELAPQLISDPDLGH
jgi:Uma2 family endonuclease